jgi:MFS family permease
MPALPSRIRTLVLVSLASLGWALSFGVGATLASLWLSAAGCSACAIGLNTTFYYLGVALAAPVVPALMRRSGRGCVVLGMVLDAFVTAAFPFAPGVVAWHVLRFAGGVGTALSLIPMETLVNRNAPPQRRARDFGVYAVCVALGIGLGPVAGLPLYPHAPRLTFALGGLVTLLATVVAWLAVPRRSGAEEDSGGAFAWRDGLLGFGTAWAQGFLEGGTITFLSLYLLSLGHAEAAVSALLGGLFAGVVAAQLPVAWLADRAGRLRTLLLCHAILFAGLVIIPFSPVVPLTAALLFVLGATCGALYPLGLALLGERVPASGLAKANAWYLACNCAGSLSGPLVIGLAIDAFGLPVQFAVGAAAVGAAVALGALGWRGAQAPRTDEARRAA